MASVLYSSQRNPELAAGEQRSAETRRDGLFRGFLLKENDPPRVVKAAARTSLKPQLC